jgi:hypothetical protein
MLLGEELPATNCTQESPEFPIAKRAYVEDLYATNNLINKGVWCKKQ